MTESGNPEMEKEVEPAAKMVAGVDEKAPEEPETVGTGTVVEETQEEEETHEEQVPMEVDAMLAEVGVDKAEARERENVGLEQTNGGGVPKKVNNEKETVGDRAVGMEVDQEVVEKEAEGEGDLSTLVRRPRRERRTRPREPTPPLREATPPREDTPLMAEQSPQLEERQTEEPNDELEAERLRRR